MDTLFNHISTRLNIQIKKITPVSGGDINRAYCLYTSAGKYFVKVNSKSLFPGMFKAEAQGLALIAQTHSIAVPAVVLQGDAGDESFLVLQWLDSKRADTTASALLGQQLAAMHKNMAAQFGLDADNYMGSLTQTNKQHSTWAGFFINERLQPMVRLAVDKGELNKNDTAGFDKLYINLPQLFGEEAPALIHGDLWGGNYLIDTHGKPYLIDPAVSYGHREFDIAMTTLFGGFSKDFYHAYHDVFPLAAGWKQRTDLWNLYPLLVHVILFGGGYAAQVRGCLRGYI